MCRVANTLQDGDQDPELSGRVESPIATYGSMKEPVLLEAMDHWLEVLRHFGLRASASAGSSFKQVREALRQGVPRSAFEQLRTDLGVSTEELAEILGIPGRTLARRTDRFKPDESERLLRVGSVVAKAADVLEDPAAARRWMTQPRSVPARWNRCWAALNTGFSHDPGLPPLQDETSGNRLHRRGRTAEWRALEFSWKLRGLHVLIVVFGHLGGVGASGGSGGVHSPVFMGHSGNPA